MKLKRQKLFSSLDSDMVKQFLGVLSGFVHKAKALHWAARGKDIHEYLDDIWKELYGFQDTLAEGYMGISGQLDSNIPFIMPESNTPTDFIKEVETKTTEFYNQLPADTNYSGLKGEFDSFIQTIEKYKYLFGLCEEKEFSEKDGKKKKGKEVAGVVGGSAALLTSGAILKRKGDKQLSESFKAGMESLGKIYDAAKVVERDIAADPKNPLREPYIGTKKLAFNTHGAKESFDKIRGEAAKKLTESNKKYLKGSVKSKAGKGLLIAGATLPVAYVAHRIKKSKKEKKEDLKKLETGKMTKAEFVEKYSKK